MWTRAVHLNEHNRGISNELKLQKNVKFVRIFDNFNGLLKKP